MLDATANRFKCTRANDAAPDILLANIPVWSDAWVAEESLYRIFKCHVSFACARERDVCLFSN
jgi:hypothetical protein